MCSLTVTVKDSAHVRNKAARIAVDVDGIKHVIGICVQPSVGRKVLGRGVRRTGQLWHQRCADRELRRVHRLPKRSRRLGA
jgi:hypothetical protein